MKNLNITNTEPFYDYSEVGEIGFNSATSFDGELYLNGFQVDVTIEVENNKGDKKTFNISFQNTERSNGMMAYNNWGLTTSSQYGNDGDDSGELVSWLEETEEYDFAEEIIDKCLDKALEISEAEYKKLVSEKENEE